jgi:hypothetical protein
MIRRIAYASRPQPGLSFAEIPRIVTASRTRNTLSGLTGVLLFTGRDFAQLIEGPPQPVADLWRCICADPRHHDLALFLDEHTPAPWFGDWRVGFPSDPAVTAQIDSWRKRSGQWDDARRGELRRLLAAIDAV